MKQINTFTFAAIISAIITNPTSTKAHTVAPWGHHYKVCEARRISTDCKTYANQREGLALEMDINGRRYPVHGTELPYPHKHR